MKVFDIIVSFLFLSLISLLIYFFGVLNLYFSDKNDYCAMTYMFEYPRFVRISLDENIQKSYPQYGLFAYSEGRFTERARKMWFDGIPVLFLPGNSGSHMQARSLASVALRKALAKGYDYHFNFFTISYNEELSGLFGGVLESQTEFAAASVSKILSLYKSNSYTKSAPSSVVLIGHSMGGLIAKRLLSYYSTKNSTSLLITLAAPLKAPIINFDIQMNEFYKLMELEWELSVKQNKEFNQQKMIISFGSGPRDLLVPAGLTSTNESYISALTTAVPGVWVSPDHVSMVWCKQLVMAINRYLFDIVDPQTLQLSNKRELMKSKAQQYFEANRSMTLNPNIKRPVVILPVDAFWYEDNRRVYQIIRPDIDRTTILMIRLVKYPQNQFVAIESVNVHDKDWIFGCNAKYTHNTYRHCKESTSLAELSRWSGTANVAERRKVATVNLHSVMKDHPEWTHVVVRVSPSKKPVTLNVDINDYYSRLIYVNAPTFGRRVIKEETEPNALYYELMLTNMFLVNQAYLLYVEPSANCQAKEYHVTAEFHVPWAKNYEYYHYFTHLKRSPMKLRLFKSNPNFNTGTLPQEMIKVTLLLDPKCTFTISISSSWYIRLGESVRNYTPILVPYVAVVLLLATTTNIRSLKKHGTCLSIHRALVTEDAEPYYAIVFGAFVGMIYSFVPTINITDIAGWDNTELLYFMRSVIVLPTYFTALGIVFVSATAILAVMVFWSQLAHRLLFRIVWRGGGNIAEKMASGLSTVPMVVSGVLCVATASCGAASLVAGAAFYSFKISKMYEDYLEDYVYRLMAKIGSKICRLFKSRKTDDQIEINTTNPNSQESTNNPLAVENSNENTLQIDDKKSNTKELLENNDNVASQCESNKETSGVMHMNNINEDLNKLNFHMMMFLLWLLVTIINTPALLTWARNFKYSMVLNNDTSFYPGFVMSVCSIVIWQMDVPRPNLKYYEVLPSSIIAITLFVLIVGPFTLSLVNYAVTMVFALITIQQLLDQEVNVEKQSNLSSNHGDNPQRKTEACTTSTTSDGTKETDVIKENEKVNKEEENEKCSKTNEIKTERQGTCEKINEEIPEECDVCNENRIYKIFKNLREKFSYNNDV
ncbi:GPI inositol-deacylase [Battus philenor]|uniref:GPI inositol-deacylase n=1 Tax=Battus philenor TaxID=42288 RepID=UPI0035CF9273